MGLDFLNIASVVSDVIKIFKESPEDKNKQELALERLKLDLYQMEQKAEQYVEEQTTARLKAHSEMLIAELQQDDAYTKRARPTVLYALLLGVILVEVVARVVLLLLGHPIPDNLGLPEIYWGVFGAGYLGYTAFRSIYDKGKHAPKVSPVEKVLAKLRKS